MYLTSFIAYLTSLSKQLEFLAMVYAPISVTVVIGKLLTFLCFNLLLPSAFNY